MTTPLAVSQRRAACPCSTGPIPPDADLAARMMQAYVLIRDRKLAVPDTAMKQLEYVAAVLRRRARLCGGSR